MFERKIYMFAYGSWGTQYYSYIASFDHSPTLDEYLEAFGEISSLIMKNHGADQTVVQHLLPMQIEQWFATKQKKESDFVELTMDK